MFIVGLTGGIATGKSTVLAIFREYGIAVIDADEVAREVMQKGTHVWHQIGKYFGQEIYSEDGTINRPFLADIVFKNAEKRKMLNSLTHPAIQKTIIKMTFRYFLRGNSYVVLELPLLFETRTMYNFMHKIITVTCENHQQLRRLCDRNRMPTEAAILRINSQMPLSEKVAKSDFVIDNSGKVSTTKLQTEAVINKLQLCKYSWYVKIAAKIFIILFLSAYLLSIYFKNYA